jgi:hypothetical protein
MSTTRRWLLALTAGLVVSTVLTTAGANLAFRRAHDAGHAAQDHAVPAVLALSTAHDALVTADRAASAGLASAGSGDDYGDAVAIARQNLAQAGDDLDERDGSRERLEKVEALLTSGSGALEQAAASARTGEPTLAATADLWYASLLLHGRQGRPARPSDSDDGVLYQLEDLRTTQQAALDAKIGDGSSLVTGTLVWAVPALVLLALLLVTQRFLSRRLRRTFNVPLVLATLALVLGAALLHAHLTELRADLDTMRTALDRRTERQADATRQVDAAGQTGLRGRLDGLGCGVGSGGCGWTAREWDRHRPAAVPANQAPIQPDDGAADTRVAVEYAGRAGRSPDPLYAVALTGTALLALVLAGLSRPLGEYRFRVR